MGMKLIWSTGFCLLPQETQGLFLPVALLLCYIISLCLKFVLLRAPHLGKVHSGGCLVYSLQCVCVWVCMCVRVYTGASGQVPMVTERHLTVCPWLHLSVCLCVWPIIAVDCYLHSERFTLSPWLHGGHWSGERPQLVISYTRAWGGGGGEEVDR